MEEVVTLVPSGFSVIFGFREDVIGLWHIHILLVAAILSCDSQNREVNILLLNILLNSGRGPYARIFCNTFY